MSRLAHYVLRVTRYGLRTTQGTYLAVARSLKPEAVADAAIHRYEPERGFLWLRRHIEPIWGEASSSPRLILYVPLAQAETLHL